MTQTLDRDFRFTTYEEAKVWFDSIDPIDDFGFQRKLVAEDPAAEIARLEFNLAAYAEFMKNLSRLPRPVHEARAIDFLRLRKLHHRR